MNHPASHATLYRTGKSEKVMFFKEATHFSAKDLTSTVQIGDASCDVVVHFQWFHSQGAECPQQKTSKKGHRNLCKKRVKTGEFDSQTTQRNKRPMRSICWTPSSWSQQESKPSRGSNKSFWNFPLKPSISSIFLTSLLGFFYKQW